MSAKHITGKLVVKNGWSIYGHYGQTPIADACINSWQDISEANARRLVACWNACEGIPTEILEDQQSSGLIAAEPDLLEALKDCKRWHQGDNWRDSSTSEQRAAWEAHNDLIDSAIAKATGVET